MVKNLPVIVGDTGSIPGLGTRISHTKNTHFANAFFCISPTKLETICWKRQCFIAITSTSHTFSSVQFSHSVVSDSATSWITTRQDSLSTTNSRSLLKHKSIGSVMPSSHLILCRPLLLLPPIPPSIRVFSNESTLRMTWPKYWSFSFSISPSNEHPGLFSFRMDWLDLLAVQGTLKSLLQHHSSKASIFRRSGFFTTLTSIHDPYMTTGKTIALTRQTFVGKVTSLLFNTSHTLVRGKCLMNDHVHEWVNNQVSELMTFTPSNTFSNSTHRLWIHSPFL